MAPIVSQIATETKMFWKIVRQSQIRR